MATDELPLDTFEQYFSEHLSPLQYYWPAKQHVQDAMADFKWHEKPGNAEEVIELKHFLTTRWASLDADGKAALAKWIVKDWGGVIRNLPETMKRHVKNALDINAKRPIQGVASYSKILSVVDYTKYAIYDARVAACLNAVQMHMKCERPVFFHYVDGRNEIIQDKEKKTGFRYIFPKKELVENRGWREIMPRDTYTTYLTMLHTLKKRFTDIEIYHLEMVLFHQSLILCPQLISNRK